MIKYQSLDAGFIVDRFPEAAEQVKQETRGYDEFLPHVVFGNVFNRLTVSLLERDGYSADGTLHRIFEMYEEMAAGGDDETRNLVQVTLLECLWDEKITFERAAGLLGERTKELWKDISSYLSAP